MVRAGWLPVVMGTAAFALVLLPLADGVEEREATDAASLPDRLASYSHRTATVSQAPPGRVVALYQHGLGVEFLDYPQAVALAADDDVYRRLDAAEERSGPQDQGDPGPMLLSPDGISAALGENDTEDAELGVVDLRTGTVVSHSLPETRSVRPVAWSPDGSQVAYLANDEPTNPYSGQTADSGDLLILDLATGATSEVPGVDRALAAAFSPDGRRLAVDSPQIVGLRIVDLQQGTVSTRSGAGVLAGPAAWSPDGRLIAVSVRSGLSFVAVDEPIGATPAELALEDPERQGFLGWSGDREVAVFARPDADTIRVLARPLDGSEPRELTGIGDQGSFAVYRFQLASGLLPDLVVRTAGEPDRGPLPPAFRILLAIVVGLAAAGLVGLLNRRRRDPSGTSSEAAADQLGRSRELGAEDVVGTHVG